MASKRNRGTSWEYIVKRSALLPKPISLTFHDEAEGDAYIAQLEKLLDVGIVPEEFKSKSANIISTIKQATEQYQSAVHITEDDVQILNALVTIHERALSAVTYQWAESWIAELRAEGGAPSRIRKKVGALARCFDWVIRRGDTMLAINPLRLLPKRYSTTAEGRKDVERDRRLQEGEEARILEILTGHKAEGRQRATVTQDGAALCLMFVLALETAMRMREMYTLTRDQVDFSKRTIFLDKTKNGSKRQVPLSSVALVTLQEYLTVHQEENLFPFWDGSYDPVKLKSTSNRLSHKWSAIFSAAGCEDLRAHDLRHEATSRFYERTKLTDVQIAKITGHSSTKMLMRYANLRGATMAEMLW